MCSGTDCPMKDSCYRYTAPVNEYKQSYFIDVPLKEDGSCDEYLKDERHKILRRTK